MKNMQRKVIRVLFVEVDGLPSLALYWRKRPFECDRPLSELPTARMSAGTDTEEIVVLVHVEDLLSVKCHVGIDVSRAQDHLGAQVLLVHVLTDRGIFTPLRILE